MKPRPPLLGYNHNVRHGGRLYHVQTEDSGVGKPHIITHVFYSGTILATTRTRYAPDEAESVVQTVMQGQHKGVLKQLRNGLYDDTLRAYFLSRGEPFEESVPRPVPTTGADKDPPPIKELQGPQAGQGPNLPAGQDGGRTAQQGSLIRRFNLERLDAPGASVATTEPYNPVMMEMESRRRSESLLDADLIGLAELAASAEEAAERIGPGSFSQTGGVPGAKAAEEDSGQVMELEAEPPSEDELMVSRATSRLERAGALPVPPSAQSPASQSSLPSASASSSSASSSSATGREGQPGRAGPHRPRPVSFQRAPSQSTPSGVRRSSYSPKRSVSLMQGRVVVVQSRPVTSPPAGRPPPQQNQTPAQLQGYRSAGQGERAPTDLPVEQTRVRLQPTAPGPQPPEKPAPRTTARRIDGGPFRPQPTAEGVVVQRPVVIVGDKGGKAAAPRINPQPTTAPRIEPPKVPLIAPAARVEPPRAPIAVDERSLDQVILAYLAEDLNNKK